ncbi:hypothetical protein ACOSQ2_004610 [Xanthoceras sorbifolium]
MTTNKERIENLEAALGGFQDHFSKIEESVTAKLQQLEITLSKTIEALLSKQQPSSSHGTSFTVRSHNTREESRESNESTRALFSSKLTKLEFPKYSGDDPTEWFTRVDQFFEFQGTMESQKVYLTSYHLEGEANQWWRWLQRTHKDEGKEVTWEIFVEELWARFGPTDCEDFDEALSKIKQTGSLRDYQKEFERLGNRVHGWTQKALVRTFMGGLKVDIADGIRMFKPKSLKKAISLARIKDERLTRHRKFIRPFNQSNTEVPLLERSNDKPRRTTRVSIKNPKILWLRVWEPFFPFEFAFVSVPFPFPIDINNSENI